MGLWQSVKLWTRPWFRRFLHNTVRVGILIVSCQAGPDYFQAFHFDRDVRRNNVQSQMNHSIVSRGSNTAEFLPFFLGGQTEQVVNRWHGRSTESPPLLFQSLPANGRLHHSGAGFRRFQIRDDSRRHIEDGHGLVSRSLADSTAASA